MHDPNDRDRVIISIFIVTAAIGIFFTDTNIPASINSTWMLAIGAFGISLVVSAVLSFLYVITKGYELRYRDSGDLNFIDKHNYLLYN